MPPPRKRSQRTVAGTRPGSSGGGTMESSKHAFQVIVLGASGGPREDMVTGLLVRSTAMNWGKSSVVAVDAGTLLAGITRTLERSAFIEKERRLEVADGPFSGLALPNRTVPANAAYVFRELIGAILVTHPHLDHIAALALNTPAIEAQSGPQKVAALPSAIAALKNHVFNDIIWPNLSDEEGGAGLVTYQRLVDGGNPRLGRGDGRGYVKVCEGLLTKCLSISHGACKQRYNPDTGRHHRTESGVFSPEQFSITPRRSSLDALEARRTSQPHPANNAATGGNLTLATVESSAFFLRDPNSEAEIIIFGDIEPDSLSLEPRNSQVWDVAAPKIVAGTLRAMFIECSYSDKVEDCYLYGHLCPRHLIAELNSLVNRVSIYKKTLDASQEKTRKRRRGSSTAERAEQLSPKTSSKDSPPARKRKKEEVQAEAGTTGQTNASKEGGPASEQPGDRGGPNDHQGVASHEVTDSETLSGLKVFLIHVKDGLSDAGSPRGQILKELEEQKKKSGLACEFIAPECGEWAFV